MNKFGQDYNPNHVVQLSTNMPTAESTLQELY